MNVTVVREPWHWDARHRRMVVLAGDQLVLISHYHETTQEQGVAEMAMCRVSHTDNVEDPPFDGATVFWSRPAVGFPEALAALAAMTPEQLAADTVDDPEFYDKVWRIQEDLCARRGH